MTVDERHFVLSNGHDLVIVKMVIPDLCSKEACISLSFELKGEYPNSCVE